MTTQNNLPSLAVETLARHFPDGCALDDGANLGYGGLTIRCHVQGVNEFGPMQTASIFFGISGGCLGEEPIIASTSGYGGSAEEAVIIGVCNWACAFAPVLHAALAAGPQGETSSFDCTIEGQPFRATINKLDRFIAFREGADEAEEPAWALARKRLTTRSWLAQNVIESGTLPLLSADRPTILSVFVADGPGMRTTEVKVNGCDWLPSHGVFAKAPAGPGDGLVLLREFAVLEPLGAAPELTRASLENVFRGLQQRDEDHRRANVEWPGWQAQGGKLGPVLSAEAVERLEAQVGPLPEDYRSFVLNVTGSGAGPGYGLLSPDSPAQLPLASGEFSWKDGDSPEDPPHGVLALAHAGCGVMWLLVLHGPHRGEVWVDAGGSDRIARRLAHSFDAWYREWLQAAIRDRFPWVQWDYRCCATAAAVSNALDAYEAKGFHGPEAVRVMSTSLKPGAITLSSAGGRYFHPGDALSPCAGCVALASSVRLPPTVFGPGVPPLQARPAGSSASSPTTGAAPSPSKPGLLSRLFRPGPKGT